MINSEVGRKVSVLRIQSLGEMLELNKLSWLGCVFSLLTGRLLHCMMLFETGKCWNLVRSGQFDDMVKKA